MMRRRLHWTRKQIMIHVKVTLQVLPTFSVVVGILTWSLRLVLVKPVITKTWHVIFHGWEQGERARNQIPNRILEAYFTSCMTSYITLCLLYIKKGRDMRVHLLQGKCAGREQLVQRKKSQYTMQNWSMRKDILLCAATFIFNTNLHNAQRPQTGPWTIFSSSQPKLINWNRRKSKFIFTILDYDGKTHIIHGQRMDTTTHQRSYWSIWLI